MTPLPQPPGRASQPRPLGPGPWPRFHARTAFPYDKRGKRLQLGLSKGTP